MMINYSPIKILFVTFLGSFMLSHAVAQNKSYESKIGLGLDAGIPVGDYKDVADYGLGISLLYQKPVASNLNITGNVGYLRFHGPAIYSGIKYKEGYVPIKAGARYFLVPHIFAAGELGISISTANGYGSGTAFAYAPGIGAEFPISKNGMLDVGLRYENWSRSGGTRSFGGIRVGYNF
uniref:hypothetical protein n=1 Tax=Pedobacter schmidteae TaxID=2201271 RepID=UPI001D019D1C|nr:hypothetical protein [Pedobacter schmidteae]